MKNFFFGISVLALLLVGCDDGNPGPGSADAVPSQPVDAADSFGKTCPIPTSAWAYTKIGTVPSVGYRYMGSGPSYFAGSHCSEAPGYFNSSTACDSPVNGFALTSSDPWCCVNAISIAPDPSMGRMFPSAYLSIPTLLCSSKTDASNLAQATAGKVALCMDDGKAGLFVGWDCDTKI